MDDDWEKIAEAPTINPINVNKWDGEDEEDDIKDSWEDDEEKKDDEKLEVKMVKSKPKKTLQEKLAEKERIKQEEWEARAKDNEEIRTPEQELEEKLRLQKIQEEADFKLAIDTFGITVDKVSGIDNMNPTNKTELSELGDEISKKLAQYRNLEDFPAVIEELVRSLCVNLNSNDLQKIKKTIDNVYTEKQKFEKEKKKSGKGKGKAKLRLEGDNANITEYYGDSYEYEDFM